MPGQPASGVRPSTLDPRLATPGQRAWQRFRRNRAAVISAWYLVILLLAIIAWPVILKISGGTFVQVHNPNQLSDAAFSPPGAQYWFGMGATFFPAFCLARKFRCSSASLEQG